MIIYLLDRLFEINRMSLSLCDAHPKTSKSIIENYSFGINNNCPTHLHGSLKSQIDVVLCPFSNNRFVTPSYSLNLALIPLNIICQVGLETMQLLRRPW